MDTQLQMDARTRLRSLCRAFLRNNGVLLAATFVIYLGFATGLTWRFDAAVFRDRDYFAMLADAFYHGRTSIDVKSPTLDMSPYNDKVYLYWGPLNAAPQLLLRLFTSRRAAHECVDTDLLFLGTPGHLAHPARSVLLDYAECPDVADPLVPGSDRLRDCVGHICGSGNVVSPSKPRVELPGPELVCVVSDSLDALQ